MLIFKEISNLTQYLKELKEKNKKLGFVPTMGALHQGHISLILRAKKENDIVVSSIFVNPTQFNNAEDLKNYPRTPEKDEKLLEENQLDILFSPSTDEIYNANINSSPIINLGKIAEVMEGAHRPGHFAGVVQIVSRLFEIVQPDSAYFGEKDFQQLAIIRFMTKALGFPVKIVGCPTIREENGLAMSSRNLRLTRQGREDAASISRALFYAGKNFEKYSPSELKTEVIRKIEFYEKLNVEYVEIADEETLLPVVEWKNHQHVRCFTATFCENIRLIDNVRLF